MPPLLGFLPALLVAIVLSSSVALSQSASDRSVRDKASSDGISLPPTIILRPETSMARSIPRDYRGMIASERLWIDRLQGLITPSFMKALKERARSRDFIGVIGEYRSRTADIAVVRYFVRTPDGPKPLVMHRYGQEFVYDGDLVVPASAILFGVTSLQDLEAPSLALAATGSAVFLPGPLAALRWPDATIPFEFADDFCCRAHVEEAIEQIHASSRMRLVERDGHEDYVRFVNAESWSTNRTQLLKQPGENVVKIQQFLKDGDPKPDALIVTGILHELGHEFGLIHEHLRPDRDDFIVRNPTCAPPDFFDALRSDWISLTNETFVDEDAVLHSDYDFETLMHYDFGVDLDEDEDGAECTSWVKIEDDCIGATCVSNFATASTWNANDIEGLEAFYASFLPENPDERAFSSDNLRHRGKRIDMCLHSSAGVDVGDRCGPDAQRQVADAFCQTQGFAASTGDIVVSSVIGVHSGFDVIQGWRDVAGADVLHFVTCANAAQDTADLESGASEIETFQDDDVHISNFRIDRCVHGDGVTGERCSMENQQLIADTFCRLEDFDRATLFETRFGPNINLAGLEPGTGNFIVVSGFDVFSRITCIRSAS